MEDHHKIYMDFQLVCYLSIFGMCCLLSRKLILSLLTLGTIVFGLLLGTWFSVGLVIIILLNFYVILIEDLFSLIEAIYRFSHFFIAFLIFYFFLHYS